MTNFFYTPTQIKHITRYIHQRIAKISVGVIGGYHGSNLGDMALGISVKNILTANGIKSGLQTIYNLEKWAKAPFSIIGGGAVGYSESLNRVAKRYKNDYKKVAILGVDFDETNYSKESLDLIKNASFVSCRSRVQAERLKNVSGRMEVHHHPDIAFSLLNGLCLNQRNHNTFNSKKLLINVMPIFAEIRNGTISPLEKYRSDRPDLYNSFDIMQNTYKRVIRSIVKEALKNRYSIETIPFTPEDESYGRLVLDGLPVLQPKYNSNPTKMLKKIATASWVIATRLHATIFTLKMGVPLSPIAYAFKNEQLLQELGIERANYLTTNDLANGIDQVPEPITLDTDKILRWEIESEKAIKECISSLLV